MTRRVSNRPRGASARVAAAVLFLILCLPSRGTAGEPFPGYPEDVRVQARAVVEAASPGKEEALEREVQSLRRVMFSRGILSINAVPDRIFERAALEGWKRRADSVLRLVTRVAPYSVPLWAWLIREDLEKFSLDRLLGDLKGLEGSLRQFGPGLIGYMVWLLLFLSAAACWFAVWASVSLLLRARPALTFDIARLFKKSPHSGVLASAVVFGCFVIPILAGVGLAVAAVFWIALSAGYLRRGEVVLATTTILLLGFVFLCGGELRSIGRVTDETRRGSWMDGEGYFPLVWPEGRSSRELSSPGDPQEALVKFARARAEMQSGNLAASERIWTELIREGRDLPGAYNNRGIVRVWLGRTEEGLADFEESMKQGPSGGVAHWNAYQLYLRLFRLDRASGIQDVAWSSLRGLKPFDYRAEEMTHGELVSSPLRVREVWEDLFAWRGTWLQEAVESPFHGFFFRPVPGKWVPWFLVAGWSWAALWKFLSRKVWMNCACRACGGRTLIVGSRDSADICNSCRAQVGRGVRSGEERDRRVLHINLHRRYVRACSVLFPGAGALWAGKDLRALIFGVLLSLPLGALTVSMGASRASQGLIADLQALVLGTAVAVASVLWAFGALWGWFSFENLQRKYNVATERK